MIPDIKNWRAAGVSPTALTLKNFGITLFHDDGGLLGFRLRDI